LHAGAVDRFSREDRRGDSGFHIADAAAEDLPVADEAAEWIDTPAVAGGYDIDVAVQVDDTATTIAAARADDVDARMAVGMLRSPCGDDVLDAESAARQVIAEKARARFVVRARRIDGWNPDEIRRELHDLVRGAIDLVDNALNGVRAHARLQ